MQRNKVDPIPRLEDVDFLVDYDRSHRSSWFPMGLIED